MEKQREYVTEEELAKIVGWNEAEDGVMSPLIPTHDGDWTRETQEGSDHGKYYFVRTVSED